MPAAKDENENLAKNEGFLGSGCVAQGSGCVAQLVERSLPIPEVRGSNPVIGKKILDICLLSTVY